MRNPIRILQTDFRAGELDPRLRMRVDSKVYPSGARSLKNMLLHTTGSASRRPGMLKLATLNQRSRLVEFEFDADENYVLAFGENHLRIYNPDGTTATTFTGSTDCPWDADAVWEITVAQQGDVMIIAHGGFRPMKLTRTGLTTFTMEEYEFDTSSAGDILLQPYVKFEPAAVTLAISATTKGTGRTLTASTGIFSADWVGDRVRIFDCEIEITAYTDATTVTATVHKDVKQSLDPNPLKSTGASGTVEVTQAAHGLSNGNTVILSGAAGTWSDVEIEAYNINGSRVITVIDDDHYSFTAGGGETASRSSDFGGASMKVQTTAPTRSWTEQAFSERRGWPSAVAFHGNRLWFGGTDEEPGGVFGSVIGSFFNFDLMEGEDDASVQVSVASARFSRVRHFVSARQLQVFTEGVELAMDGGDGEAITPASVRVATHTTYGSGAIRPKVFDGATIFVQGNGKTVREFIYDFGQNGFQSTSLSAASAHLVSAPRDMAILYGTETRSEQYAFVVNSDGTVACFHSIRSEELAAWTPFEAGGGGLFDSVCTIGTRVYFSVLRDGSYYLEQFALDDDDIWLDGAIRMTAGAPTVNWALGSDYADKTVTIMSNDRYVSDFTADGSGNIVLEAEVDDIVAGYDYGIEVIPMTPDKELPDGPSTGEKRRIVSATIHVHDSVSLAVDGTEMLGVQIGDDLSEPLVRYSVKKRVRLFGYDRDPVITITQPLPGPSTILGLSMEVSL